MVDGVRERELRGVGVGCRRWGWRKERVRRGEEIGLEKGKSGEVRSRSWGYRKGRVGRWGVGVGVREREGWGGGE